MAKGIHPLDARIAIADAFEAGRLSRRATSREIAEVTGVGEKRVSRLNRLLNSYLFQCVQQRRKVNEVIPTRWAPPRNWPTLKRRGTVAWAIKNLYDAGEWTGPCYARDFAERLETTEETVVASFKTLKFKVTKRAWRKFVRYDPPVWERTNEWPELFVRQRELRRSGLSAASVTRITDAAAEVPAIITEAVRRLDVADVPLHRRGVLKHEVKQVIADVHRQATRDSVARAELAGWLRVDEETPVGKLQAIIDTLQAGQPAEVPAPIDWAEIAELDAVRLANFVKIAARMALSGSAQPEEYALRWLRENQSQVGKVDRESMLA